MKKPATLLVLGFLGLAGFAQVASAGPFEDGAAAYDRDDYATALRLLRPFADQGNAYAQHALGYMYDLGKGVAEDNAEAAKWLLLAAKQGEPKSQYNLAEMYQRGEGVALDNVKAHMWFTLAGASAGSLPGGTARAMMAAVADSRSKLAAKMTPAQVATAQDLATKCQQSNFKQCD